MKILQVNNYHYIKGGSERVYLETGRMLQDHGHEVFYFSIDEEACLDTGKTPYFPKYNDPQEMSLIGQLLSTPQFIYSSNVAHQFERLLLKVKPDVVHLHIFYGRLTSAILSVLKKHAIPTVQTLHEYRMLCPAYNCLNAQNTICNKCFDGQFQQCIYNKCIKGKFSYSLIATLDCWARDHIFKYTKVIDTFIFPSKFILNLHTKHRKSIADKAVHICNFHDVENTQPNYTKGNYFLYVGRLSVEKGIITLIKAFKELSSLKLFVVGTGPDKQHINEYIHQNHINNIDLLGYKTGAQLDNLIANSLCAVIPSECYENNPMSVIECHAFGKPVIGADIGGIPELVQIDGFDLLFQSGSVESLSKAIKSFIRLNNSEYLNLSQACRKKAENTYSREQHYKKLISVYNKAISKNRNEK